jgi:hypothetical protein
VDTDVTTEVVPTEVEQNSTVEDDDADRTTGVNADSTTDGADRTTGKVTEETTEMPNRENDATGVPQDSGTAQVEGIGNGMNIGTTGVPPEETTLPYSNGEDDNPPSLYAPRSDDSKSDEEEDDQYDAYHPNTMTQSVQRAHGLRPRRARDYSHMFSHATVMHHAMTQYSLKKGLRKFKKVGEAAVSKELSQLHMRDTLAPQDNKNLTAKQKREALESMMFLKEKRDGTIKGRACADRRKQRDTAVPRAATSPTVSVESVMITATIDAHEGRDVAVVDVQGAFPSADMDEYVLMTIKGRL